MIWGDTDLLRRITVAVGDDPAIDQLLVLYDHPQGLAPEAAAEWAAVRAGIVAGADETEAATLVASTLPDLIDDEASGELAERGVPAVAGLRTALVCARALRIPPADPGRLREIARRRRLGRDDATPAPTTGGWTRSTLRSSCGPPGCRCRRAGWSRARTRRARRRELGGPVAVKISRPGLLHKSDAGALRLGRRRGRRPRGRVSRALGAAGGRRGECSWSAWRRPGSSCWSPPGPTPSSRRW